MPKSRKLPSADYNKSLELSKSGDDIYQIEGIASKTGVPDKEGEILAHGSLDENANKVVPIWVMHQGVKSTIGSATLVVEGDTVKFTGTLYDDVEAARAIARNKADGVKFNVSIGGRRLDYAFETIDGEMYLVTKRLMIREVSITGEEQQAHQDAVVTKTLENDGGSEMTKEEVLKLIEESTKALVDANTQEEIKKAVASLADVKAELAKMDKPAEVVELEKTVTDLTKSMADLEKQIAESQKINHGSVTDVEKVYAAEKATFEKYLRSNGLDSAELAKAVDTSSAGKLIPQMLVNEIIKDIKEASIFFAKAKMYTGSRPEIDIPVRKSWTNMVNAVAEGDAVANKGTYGVELLNIKAAKIQSEVELTDEMRDDSDFNLVAEIQEVNVEDFAEYISDKIVRGVTTSTQAIEGFTVNSTVTAAAQETVTAGEIAWDDFIELEMSLKAADRIGAAYYVSRDALTKMKLMKDSMNRPLWIQSLVPGAPSTFNGYPVYECPDMDSVAADNFPVLFANLGLFYAMYVRKAMETEMDRNASAGKDIHITRMRLGGKVRKATAGKLLKVKP